MILIKESTSTIYMYLSGETGRDFRDPYSISKYVLPVNRFGSQLVELFSTTNFRAMLIAIK